MDLISMETFVALCRHKSFTKAAEQMYVTQPTISKRISALEIELGVQLLDRTTTRVVLTTAGQILFERCEQLLQLRYDTEKCMSEMRGGIKQVLRIATPPDSIIRVVGPAIQQMGRMHPDIELQFFDMSKHEFIYKLLNNEYNVVLCMRKEIENTVGIKYRLIQHFTYGVLVGEMHPFFIKNAIHEKELLTQKIVLHTSEKSEGTNTVSKYYEALGYNRRSILFAPNRASMLYYVCTGKYLGVSVVNKDFVEFEGTACNLMKAIPLIGNTFSGGDMVIAYRENDPAAEIFADAVTNYKAKNAYGTN